MASFVNLRRNKKRDGVGGGKRSHESIFRGGASVVPRKHGVGRFRYVGRTIGFAVRRRQRRLCNLIRTIALRPPSLGLIPTSPAVQALRERERMIQANDPQTERLRCRYALAHLRSQPLRGGGTQSVILHPISLARRIFMKLRYLPTLFTAGIFMLSFAHAAPPHWRAVDVTSFDIAGVKLGMNYNETLAAMSKHFKLSSNEIEKFTQKSQNRITKNQQPTAIRYNRDGILLTVEFFARIPVESGNPVAVSRINYGIPNPKGNISALKEASISKYGQPSDNRYQSNLMWCAHYNQITQCDSKYPRLSLTMGSMVLEDPRFEAAERKFEQDLLKTKPNI